MRPFLIEIVPLVGKFSEYPSKFKILSTPPRTIYVYLHLLKDQKDHLGDHLDQHHPKIEKRNVQLYATSL